MVDKEFEEWMSGLVPVMTEWTTGTLIAQSMFEDYCQVVARLENVEPIVVRNRILMIAQKKKAAFPKPPQ